VNRKISLNSTDVEALRRLVSHLGPAAAEVPVGQPVAVTVVQSSELVTIARLIFQARANRTRQFKQAIFGEPAWDMLLALYASADSTRLPVGQICSLSGSPPTTALRWLDYLEREQFVLRRPHPHDARSAIVELTSKGRSALEEYLSETLVLLR
jgi:DNA-binding MarR family transcriptional regulator